MEQLQEAIDNAFENVKSTSGADREAAVEEVKTLYELQLAEKKLDFDVAKEESRIEEQAKQRKVDLWKEIGLEVAKVVLVGIGTASILAFEKEDTITNLGTREFLKNIPRIKL